MLILIVQNHLLIIYLGSATLVSEKKFTHKIVYNNVVGTMNINGDKLSIRAMKNSRQVDLKFISRVFLSEISGSDLEIELKNGEVIHLVLTDPVGENFSNTLDYIDDFSDWSHNESITNDEKVVNTQQPQEPDESTEQGIESENTTSSVVMADVTINKNLLYNLPNETFIKQDLNTITSMDFTKRSEFGVYPEYVSINNVVYELNIPYNVINAVELNDSLGLSLVVTLTNGGTFFVKPDKYFKTRFNNMYAQINYFTNNTPKSNMDLSSNYTYSIPQPQNNQYYMNPNMYNQQPQFQNYTNQVPRQNKSILIAVVLHLLLPGLGYAYLDRWGKFIITLIAIALTVIISLAVISIFSMVRYRVYPTSIWLVDLIIMVLRLLPVLIWVYVLINTIMMVDKYNNRESY